MKIVIFKSKIVFFIFRNSLGKAEFQIDQNQNDSKEKTQKNMRNQHEYEQDRKGLPFITVMMLDTVFI